jgi:hypothetical protein
MSQYIFQIVSLLGILVPKFFSIALKNRVFKDAEPSTMDS